MEVRCHGCGKVHQLADESFGDRDHLDFKCTACGRAMHITSPILQTLRVEKTRKKVAAIAEEVSPEGRVLSLPENQELTLRVLAGEEKGTVYPLTKARTLIGRGNAEVRLNDPLASRLHCAVEVSEDSVVLRDLDSTNGTLVDNQPIVTSTLVSGSTFRVGNHVFQLVISPKGA